MKKNMLIVGLGNPGIEYDKTRHNVGFMVIDALEKELGIMLDKNNFSGKYGFSNLDNKKIILAKPMTFMNLSGNFLINICKFYRIDISDIIVIYDDLDFKLGTFKLKVKGSSAGHNGMKNIIECMGSSDIKRIRIGISVDKVQKNDKISFVLSRFSKDELIMLSNVISDIVKIIKLCILNDFEYAMQKANSL